MATWPPWVFTGILGLFRPSRPRWPTQSPPDVALELESRLQLVSCEDRLKAELQLDHPEPMRAGFGPLRLTSANSIRIITNRGKPGARRKHRAVSFTACPAPDRRPSTRERVSPR